MKCVEFNLAEHLSILEQYLKDETDKSDDPAAENMWCSDWTDKPNSVLYMLKKTNKFNGSNGNFFLIFDGAQIAACGGVQLSNFNNKIAIAGVRTWVSKDYRNKSILAKTLLPEHKAWALEHSCKQVALTFNQYNKNLSKIFTRIRAGETGDRISGRTPDRLFYSGVNELDFKVCIQYTPQWVIYDRLDADWEFDWLSIRSK